MGFRIASADGVIELAATETDGEWTVATSGGSGGGGDASAANQDEQTTELQAVNTKLTALDGRVDGLETLVAATNTALGTVETVLDDILIQSPIDASGNRLGSLADAGGQPLEFISPLSLFSANGQNALVNATAEVILAANASRIGLMVCNTHATEVVYIGDSAALTTANGFPLSPGGLLASAPYWSRLVLFDYNGPIWAIATTNTPNLAYLEW